LFETGNEPVDQDYLLDKLDDCVGDITKTLEGLENSGFLLMEGNTIKLTTEGKKLSEFIESKHLSLEHFFERLFNKANANEIAHFLEHKFTDEILVRFKNAADNNNGAIPITKYKMRNGVIKHVHVKDFNFFNRVISLGLIPSQHIEIIQDNQVTFLIGVKDTRLAIDRDLACEILVAPY
jgi:Mn-dependent DtxR family transcriptional regulator